MLCEERTAAEFGNVANATRRRRRILKSGFFLTLNVKTEILTSQLSHPSKRLECLKNQALYLNKLVH